MVPDLMSHIYKLVIIIYSIAAVIWTKRGWWERSMCSKAKAFLWWLSPCIEVLAPDHHLPVLMSAYSTEVMLYFSILHIKITWFHYRLLWPSTTAWRRGKRSRILTWNSDFTRRTFCLADQSASSVTTGISMAYIMLNAPSLQDDGLMLNRLVQTLSISSTSCVL